MSKSDLYSELQQEAKADVFKRFKGDKPAAGEDAACGGICKILIGEPYRQIIL